MLRPTAKPFADKGLYRNGWAVDFGSARRTGSSTIRLQSGEEIPGPLKKVRAAKEWTRQQFANASPDTSLHHDSVMSRNKMQSQVIPIHIRS